MLKTPGYEIKRLPDAPIQNMSRPQDACTFPAGDFQFRYTAGIFNLRQTARGLSTSSPLGLGAEVWRNAMTYTPINLPDKFSLFSEHWSPRIVAQMNDYHLKLVKIQGEFVWHSHADTDEVFVVLDGSMDILFRDGQVTLHAGEMFVVPKGVEHKPVAARECRLMLVEPAGTINTGDAGGELTAEDNVWI
jgi:mannose-6-phosphate isomerase-like protein (cupin superfamily)